MYTFDCSATPNENEKLSKVEGFPSYPRADIAKFSPINGKLLAVVDSEGIYIVDVQ